MVSIPISFHMIDIFFGPIPFIFSISTMPGGVFSIISFKASNSPVSKSSIIFLPVDSPMPFILKIFSRGVSSKGIVSFSILKAALA